MAHGVKMRAHVVLLLTLPRWASTTFTTGSTDCGGGGGYPCSLPAPSVPPSVSPAPSLTLSLDSVRELATHNKSVAHAAPALLHSLALHERARAL